MVELRESRPGLLRLLVRVCAVVGGAFALTGLLDKLVHRAVTAAVKARAD
jgi:demethoxyubiquinone hydroxylase (CLK1/Coq7/Cat5 family)